MQFTSSALRAQRPVPADHAFGVPDPEQHVTLGDNINPPFELSLIHI